jgi:hypothetical protein
VTSALLICTPYLLYTYSISGKLFYWSNAGGMSLYWMSNPYDREWGEWYNDELEHNGRSPEKIREHHAEPYSIIYGYQGTIRDDKFKEFALENIRVNPGKFFLNWLANWSRMFFNYPVSYTPIGTGTIANAIANVPVLALLIFSAFKSLKRKEYLPDFLKFMLLISAIYLLGSSFLSAYDRMFYILWPVLACWIVYDHRDALAKI